MFCQFVHANPRANYTAIRNLNASLVDTVLNSSVFWRWPPGGVDVGKYRFAHSPIHDPAIIFPYST